KQQLLELAQLQRWYDDVRSDSAPARHLSATVSQPHFRGMLRHFALIVILVERNRFVVALNQAPARCVIARGSQSQAGVFAERRSRWLQAFAKRGFSHIQSAVLVPHGPRNDFRG